MCGIWDWQSMIVKDIDNSQDPKLNAVLSRKRICRDLRAIFRQQMSAFYPFRGDGVAQSRHCLLFSHFSFMMASLTFVFGRRKNQQCTVHFAAAFVDPRLCPREFASNTF